MAELDLWVIGVSHKSAPVEVREKISFKENFENVLLELNSLKGVEESMLLSTCNRVEAYVVSRFNGIADVILDFFRQKGQLSPEQMKSFYVKRGREAVKHGFMVASSLDSMVIGEPQIVGQFKDAFFLAKDLGTAGRVLSRFCESALKVSKKVRRETAIAKNAVSISFAAVELAKKIFGYLNDKTVAIVGAGEMAELAVLHLVSAGVKNVLVVNRTLSKAQELAAKFGGKAYRLSELSSVLESSDIVIVSTGADDYVVKSDLVKEVMKRRSKRSLFMIDISVPRNISPDCSKISGVYLYDIDDLKRVVEANLKERQRAAAEAEKIVEEQVEKFEAWFKQLEVGPLIAELKRSAEKIRKQELSKRLPKLGLTQEQEREIDNLTRVIVNKLLHEPITNVKRKAAESESNQIVQFVREIFGLGKE